MANTDSVFWAVAQPETGWIAVCNQNYTNSFIKHQPASLDDFIGSDIFSDDQQETVREALSSQGEVKMPIKFRLSDDKLENAMLSISSCARPKGFYVIKALKA